MTPDEAIKIVDSIVKGRIQHGGQPDILDEVLLTEIKRFRCEFHKIQNMLIAKCESGQLFHTYTYDKSKSVLENLICILEALTFFSD